VGFGNGLGESGVQYCYTAAPDSVTDNEIELEAHLFKFCSVTDKALDQRKSARGLLDRANQPNGIRN
jgi:hypothetical protein